MTEAKIILENLQSNVPGKSLTVAKFSGQLDESNIDQLIMEIYKAIELTPKNLNMIFDFENLEYMNSKTLGYITDIYGKISENGGTIVITKAKANITDILQVVGLSQLIPLLFSNEEAMLQLSKTAQTTTVTQSTQTAPAVQTKDPVTEQVVVPNPVTPVVPVNSVITEPTVTLNTQQLEQNKTIADQTIATPATMENTKTTFPEENLSASTPNQAEGSYSFEK